MSTNGRSGSVCSGGRCCSVHWSLSKQPCCRALSALPRAPGRPTVAAPLPNDITRLSPSRPVAYSHRALNLCNLIWGHQVATSSLLFSCPLPTTYPCFLVAHLAFFRRPTDRSEALLAQLIPSLLRLLLPNHIKGGRRATLLFIMSGRYSLRTSPRYVSRPLLPLLILHRPSFFSRLAPCRTHMPVFPCATQLHRHSLVL